MKKRVERLQDRGEITSDQATRQLTMHMKVVSHYADQDLAAKVLKHMEGFQRLIEMQHEKSQLTDKRMKHYKLMGGIKCEGATFLHLLDCPSYTWKVVE